MGAAHEHMPKLPQDLTLASKYGKDTHHCLIDRLIIRHRARHRCAIRSTRTYRTAYFSLLQSIFWEG